MSVLKKLAGQAATYGISSILGRLLNFLLVPFLTRPEWSGISPAGFGVFSELYAYMAFLNIIYTFGMETAFFRFATREGGDKEKAFNTAQSAVTAVSILLTGSFILFSGSLSEVLKYPASYIILLSIILAIDAIVAIPFARLRLENKAAKFASFKLINILLNIFFTFFFLFLCRKIYYGEMLATLRPLVALFYIPGFEVGYIILSNLFANFLQIPMLGKNSLRFNFYINKGLFFQMFRYAYPIMFMGIAAMVNEVLDRILLRVLLQDDVYPGISTQAAIGIYGACYRFSIFMSLAVQAFRYASEPFFFSRAADKDAPDLYARVMKYFIIFCTFLYVFVGCNLPALGLILGDELFNMGLGVVPVLLLANLFFGIYVNLSVAYKVTDKTYVGTIITFIAAGITIVANFILIPRIGFHGSAIATLLAYGSMALMGYFWGQKYFPVPYKVTSALVYLFLSTAVIWATIIFVDLTGMFRILLGLIVASAYCMTVIVVEKKNLQTDLQKT